MTKQIVVWLGLIIAIGVLLTLGFVGSAVSDGGEPVEIDECTVIESPGEYVLTDNIEHDGASCIEIRDVENVEIDGQGNVISGEFGTGLGIHDSTNITVRDVGIDGGEFNGLLVENSSTVTILENTVDAGDQGISIRDGSNNLVINGNTVTTEHDTGIMVSESSEINISNNYVEDTGINSIRVGDGSTEILIHGNEIYDSGAIMAWNASNVEITENTVDHVQYGINVREGSSDVVVRNNVVTNTTHCAFDVKTNSRNVLIEDNYAFNHSGIGLAENVSNVTIRNNVVEDGHGIEGQYFGSIHAVLSSNDITISDNTIINSTKDGIHLSGWDEITHDISVQNNTVVGAEDSGIFLDDTTHDVSVQGNYLTKNRVDIEDQNPDENVVEGNILDPIQVIGSEIDQKEVMAGEVISVSVDIENLASAKLSSNVRFKIDGELVEMTEIDVPPRTVFSIEFEHVFDAPGEYSIQVNGVEVGTVSVEEDHTPTPTPTPTPEDPTATPDETAAPTPEDDPTSTPDDSPIPGFGVIVALLGLIAVAVLLRNT